MSSRPTVLPSVGASVSMHSSANERVFSGASAQARCGLRLPPKPSGVPIANSAGMRPRCSKLSLQMRMKLS